MQRLCSLFSASGDGPIAALSSVGRRGPACRRVYVCKCLCVCMCVCARKASGLQAEQTVTTKGNP